MDDIEHTLDPKFSVCSFPSVEERYFSLYSDDQGGIIRMHSNRICLVGIDSSHPALSGGQKIVKLDFQVSEKTNRLANQVRGKGKKGAQGVDERALLAYVETEDGQRHPVRANVKGKIVEINERLVNDPELLSRDPLGKGYVGIVLPKLPDGLKEMKERLTLKRERTEIDLS